MLYGFGRGGDYGRGNGGMGNNFRGSSPPWPYVGRGRGGLPRCGYFIGSTGAPAPRPYEPSLHMRMQATTAYPPYVPPITLDEELNYLKYQSEAVKSQLNKIESRINNLDKEK